MNKIKEYWNQRALDSPKLATTNDIYFRELEIRTIIDTIKDIYMNNSVKEVLDLGSGDGYSTIKIANEFPDIKFTGIDYSKNMIDISNASICGNKNIKFINDDIINLYKYNKLYDIIISDRCLINLESKETQYKMIKLISCRLKENGTFIALENFIETHENLNKVRRIYGLDEIEIGWHNIYFKESEFIEESNKTFKNICFKDFASSYYFATRVIYSYMCAINMEDPDYEHNINRLSILLPPFGKFCPTRMVILKRN